VESASAAAGEYLESIRVFDVFEGASVGEGMKSLALAFRFRAPDRTLTDEEAAPIRKAIAEMVVARTGGSLRGEV
jgi:phenylalanyl-tRNA synthetase beta chain